MFIHSSSTSLIMTIDPRPFYDIQFNFKVSLSLEDSVLALLGWPFDFEPFREMTETEQALEWACAQEGIDNQERLSLFEVLRDIKRSADSAYTEAKIEDPENHDLLKNCREEIQKTHELMTAAYYFYSDIVNELSKGESSLLRLDSFTHHEQNSPHITWESLRTWARTKDIDLDNPGRTTEFTKAEIDPSKVGERLTNDKSVDARDLLLTFANLALKYAEIPKYRKSDGLNKDQFFKDVFYSYPNTQDYPGLGRQTINNRLKLAFQVKNKTHGGCLRFTQVTNLNRALAVLVINYADKLKLERDFDDVWINTVSCVIEDTATPGQDRKSIANRLKTAHQSL
jgi:hypothetical protein